MFTQLIEHEIHQDNVISEAHIKYAEFCDHISELDQAIQDYVLVSNYLVRAFAYKSTDNNERSSFENAIISCTQEALERLNLQHLLEIKDDS